MSDDAYNDDDDDITNGIFWIIMISIIMSMILCILYIICTKRGN
jgi:hypothetical protein